MKHKDEAQPLIKHFFRYVSTQFESHIKNFRSDNGGEFLSLQSFFKDNGVLFQHYTPQQNGVVERKHRHILQVERALKIQAQLPNQFWGECALTAVLFKKPLTFTCSLFQNTIRMPLLETTLLLSPPCVWLSRLFYQCPFFP